MQNLTNIDATDAILMAKRLENTYIIFRNISSLKLARFISGHVNISKNLVYFSNTRVDFKLES